MRRLTVQGFSAGVHNDLHNLNPAEALTIGGHPTRLKTGNPELGIYCLATTYPFGGATRVHNFGHGDPGSLEDGTPITVRSRQVIRNPYILFSSHPSLGGFDPNVSGVIWGIGLHGLAFLEYGDRGVYVKFEIDNTNQVLKFTRRFCIVDEPYGKRTSENIVHEWDETYSAPGYWDPTAFNVFAFTVAHPRWTLFVNGDELGMYDVAPLFDLGGNVPPYRKVVQSHWWAGSPSLGPLTGDLWGCLYFGGSLPSGFLRLPDRGSWVSPIYDLAADGKTAFALHRLSWEGWACSFHTLRLTVQAGFDPALEDCNSLGFDLREPRLSPLYPDPSEYLQGRYCRLVLDLASQYHFGPWVSKLDLDWRPLR